MTIQTVKISKLMPAATGPAARPTLGSAQAKPLVWLGAKSPFGLALPDAHPSDSQLYAPRGIWIDDQRLIVCDSGNHRVMIWNQIPTDDGAPADIVLGQTGFDTEGAAGSGCNIANGFKLPTGVQVIGNRLVIADAWHHRLLVWREIPRSSNTPPDYAIGQASLNDAAINRGLQRPNAQSLYWPYGFSQVGKKFYVADTGNRRVLGWQTFPDADRPADEVWGQPDFEQNSENRGCGVSADSFRWPHDIAGDSQQLFVADAGNHRVLFWNQRLQGDRPADGVIGQETMDQAMESPYRPPGPQQLRFPYSIATTDHLVAIADTANNRVLFFRRPLASAIFPPAMDVIGQVDFDGNGENHWQAVTHHTLCWPYGICLHGNRLAVADSGNNRVMIWDCSEILSQLNIRNTEPSRTSSVETIGNT